MSFREKFVIQVVVSMMIFSFVKSADVFGLQFIDEESVDYGKLFGSNIYDYDDKKAYKINESAFENIEAYKEILKGRQ